MEWLNLHTSVLDGPEFLGAEPIDRATWICLLRYCIGQENGGRIAGCKKWKERSWLIAAGVTREEVNRNSHLLWKWDGDDLVIWKYPTEMEKEVKAKRAGGSEGGKSGRGQKKARFGNQNASSTQAKRKLNASQTQAKRKLNASQTQAKRKLNATEGEGEGEGEREGNTQNRGACEALQVSFDTFLQAYPTGHRRGVVRAETLWREINTPTDTSQEILDSLPAWKDSPQWTKDNGAMIPNIDNFLLKRTWIDAPKNRLPDGIPDAKETERLLKAAYANEI